MESGNEVAIDMLQIQIADNDNSYVSWKTKCGEYSNTATGYKSLKTLLKDFPLRMRIDFRHLFCFSFSFFARQPPYIRSNHNILHLFAVQENLFEGFTLDYLSASLALRLRQCVLYPKCHRRYCQAFVMKQFMQPER